MLSTRIRTLVQQQWAGLIALFLVLSGGTALAVDGPLPGTNQVGSQDIINGEVSVNDLGGGSVVTGKIADGQVHSEDLASNAIADDTLNPLTGSTKIAADAVQESELSQSSVFSPEVAPNSLTGDDIATDSLTGTEIADQSIGSAELGSGSVGSSEAANNSLTGIDIDESTLAALDGHDGFDAFCDPSTNSYLNCDSLTFTVGRRMPVLTMFDYGFSGFSDEPFGSCRATLDGTETGAVTLKSTEFGSLLETGGVPVVDVLTLDAGTHTIGFDCAEFNPDTHDLEIRDLRIAVVELGMD